MRKHWKKNQKWMMWGMLLSKFTNKHSLKCLGFRICLISHNEHNAVWFYEAFHCGIISGYGQINTIKSMPISTFFHVNITEWSASVKSSKNQVYLEINNALCAMFTAWLLTHVWLCPLYELITFDIQDSHWAKEKAFKCELKALSLNIRPQIILCLSLVVILT